MIKTIDSLLNRITMYRLVLYYLIFLLLSAAALSLSGLLKINIFALLFSNAFLLAVCLLVNWIFSKTFGVPPNVESAYITALILTLIISPIGSFSDLWFLAWAGILAMASKYILAIGRKHIFNPAALAVAITYFALNLSASWWVGTGWMLPFVLLGGILVVRKIERTSMVLTFLATAFITSLLINLFVGGSWLSLLSGLTFSSPLFFFAFIILTEPLTTPPNRPTRLVYGMLTGVLFSPQVHFGSFFITPELAILIANVFSYLVSPKRRLVLTLREKKHIAPDIYDFIFTRSDHMAFAPGQYMEWTLGHEHPDSRGNRRYFTLASAPTERNLRVGIRISTQSSSYKRTMMEMKPGDRIIAGQVAGDFILPKDPRQKIVLIAGGVGVTPFRSMVKYLLDTRQRRHLTLFYADKSPEDFVYRDVFDRAQKELGLKVIYTVTDPAASNGHWTGEKGRVTPQLIRSQVPDYQKCLFYLSGPRSMVDSFKEILHLMNVPAAQVKTDFFQGLN